MPRPASAVASKPDAAWRRNCDAPVDVGACLRYTCQVRPAVAQQGGRPGETADETASSAVAVPHLIRSSVGTTAGRPDDFAANAMIATAGFKETVDRIAGRPSTDTSLERALRICLRGAMRPRRTPRAAEHQHREDDQ